MLSVGRADKDLAMKRDALAIILFPDVLFPDVLFPDVLFPDWHSTR